MYSVFFTYLLVQLCRGCSGINILPVQVSVENIILKTQKMTSFLNRV